MDRIRAHLESEPFSRGWIRTIRPATPREGYPVEFRCCGSVYCASLPDWGALQRAKLGRPPERAAVSLERFFCWKSAVPRRPAIAKRGQPHARRWLTTLRSNIFWPSPRLLSGDSSAAKRRGAALPGCAELTEPGPLPVRPLAVAQQGVCLNDPEHPYSGRYEGMRNASKPA